MNKIMRQVPTSATLISAFNLLRRQSGSTSEGLMLSDLKRVLENNHITMTDKETRELFDIIDVSHTGSINFHDFIHEIQNQHSLQKGNYLDDFPANKQLKNRDAKMRPLSHRPLAPMVSKPLQTMCRHILSEVKGGQHELLKAFKKFCSKGKSESQMQVDFIEFRRVLQNCGIGMEEKSALQLFQELDMSHTNAITYADFAAAINAGSHNDGMEMRNRNDHYSELMKQYKARAAGRHTREPTDPLEVLRNIIGSQVGSGSHQGLKSFKKLRRKGRSRNNIVDYNEFKTALQNCGIDLTEVSAMKVFKRMDISNTGSINYDDFIKTVMQENRAQVPEQPISLPGGDKPRRNDSPAGEWNSPENPLDVLRRRLRQEITGGPGQLLRAFKQFRFKGRSSDNVVDFDEFRHALQNCGINLKRLTVRKLFHAMDVSQTGAINYQDFVAFIEMLEIPKPDQTDTSEESGLDPHEHDKALMKLYKTRAKDRPAVQNILESPLDVVRRKITGGITGGSHQLLRAFKNFKYKGRSADNNVTFKEFTTCLSNCGIKMDEYSTRQLFTEMDVSKTGSINYQDFIKALSKKKHAQPPLISLKMRLEEEYEGGARALYNVLQNEDIFEGQSRDCSLSLQDFRMALRDNGVQLNKYTLKRLFNCMDTGKKGSITYENFQTTLLAMGASALPQPQRSAARPFQALASPSMEWAAADTLPHDFRTGAPKAAKTPERPSSSRRSQPVPSRSPSRRRPRTAQRASSGPSVSHSCAADITMDRLAPKASLPPQLSAETLGAARASIGSRSARYMPRDPTIGFAVLQTALGRTAREPLHEISEVVR